MNRHAVDANAPSVLIVDDDPESLLLVGTMIEYVGYRPVTAATFDEAREQLRQRPAALVLDLVMPERTSQRLIDELLESRNALPVVLMSALLRDDLGTQAAELARRGLNVVSTLAKPFWVDVLVAALEKAIPDAPEAAIRAD
jgi:CheY-like chemotaxis protein